MLGKKNRDSKKAETVLETTKETKESKGFDAMREAVKQSNRVLLCKVKLIALR